MGKTHTYIGGNMSNYAKDLVERVVSTYIVTLLGLAIAGWADVKGISSLSFLGTAALAAIPAALSVLKGGLAKFTGNPESASLNSNI